jgi:hypothetical protein
MRVKETFLSNSINYIDIDNLILDSDKEFFKEE